MKNFWIEKAKILKQISKFQVIAKKFKQTLPVFLYL